MNISILRVRRTSRNILEMSAETPTQCFLNLIRTLESGGYWQGPDSRISLRLTPEVVLAEASKTGRSLVVVDESLKTPWTGR